MLNRDFDLNLLKVLVALLQERNTYRAAELLGTSQPSVSRSLAKLRVLLDDPLFYRDKRSLKLSPRAEELSKSLPSMYSALLDTFEQSVFKPSNYDGTVKIAMNAYVAELFGAKIYQHLSSLMPKLTIELLSWNERTSHQILAEQVDIALSFLPMNLPKSIYERKVGSLEFGFIGSKLNFGHLTRANIKEIAKYPISTVLIPEYNSQELRMQKVDEIVERLDVVLKSHHISPILALVENSNTLFAAPIALYNIVDQNKFQFIEVIDLDTEIHTADIGMIYNSKNRQSPVFKWLDLQIKECFK